MDAITFIRQAVAQAHERLMAHDHPQEQPPRADRLHPGAAEPGVGARARDGDRPARLIVSQHTDRRRIDTAEGPPLPWTRSVPRAPPIPACPVPAPSGAERKSVK